MDNIITVGSFDVKDTKVNRKGGIREHGTSNAKVVSEVIKDVDIDMLGLQELTKKYEYNLGEELKDYYIEGNYRYGDGIFKNIPYNEGNNIISKEKVLYGQTWNLPWLPNIKNIRIGHNMPRIATFAIVGNDFVSAVGIINTHLDYIDKDVQKKQLKAIKKILFEYSKIVPVFITGNFNMELKDEHFNEFMDSIASLVKRVPIDDYTWYGDDSKKTVDHIFVPNSWNVIEAGVINDGDIVNTSSHRLVYAKAYKR